MNVYENNENDTTTMKQNDKDFCYFNFVPDEICLKIMFCLHPIYDDLVTLSTVCKKWRRFLIWDADPSFWENIIVHNISVMNRSHDFVLRTFRQVLCVVGPLVKVLDISTCSEQFSQAICDYSFNLTNLRRLKVVRTKWNKGLLSQLCCRCTLEDISLDPSNLRESQSFKKGDFTYVIDHFTNLEGIGLEYQYFQSESLRTFTEVILSDYGQMISKLSFDTAQINYCELHFIVSKLKNLKFLTYGNAGITSNSSQGSRCVIESESLEGIEFMNVSSLRDLKLYTSRLKRVFLKACTSLIIFKLNSESLSHLSLVCCSSLQTLDGVKAPYMKEFMLRFCRQIPHENLVKFLKRHSFITKLTVQPHWPSLDLSYSCCLSMIDLHLFCGSDVLLSVNITAPKMLQFYCTKSSAKQTNIREINLFAKSLFKVTVQGIPKLANLKITAETLSILEIDFGNQNFCFSKYKKPCFVKLLGKAPVCTSLKVRRCNIESLRLHDFKVKYLFLDACILSNFSTFNCSQRRIENVFTKDCTEHL